MSKQKIENIQFPFPEEASKKTEELKNSVEESIKSATDTPDTKSIDLYEGLPIPVMVSDWGIDKTREYLNSSADLYKIMGMRKQAKQVKAAMKKYDREYLVDNTGAKKKKAKENFKEKVETVADKIKSDADKAVAKADKYEKKLSKFTANRRADIQAIVQVINDIPDRDSLENFVANYFLGKVTKKFSSSTLGTKISNSLEEKVKNKTLPLKDILKYAQEIMSLYQAAQGISLDNVVSIVTSLVTLQFQPYITKYNQYVRTVNDLEMLIQEYTVIIDAVNSKAVEYGSPMTIQVPNLPSLPDLPEIPV